MKPLFILILFFPFNLIGFSQQTLPDSLGFTNKAEAKNQMVNGLKEGKWFEYVYIGPNGEMFTDNNDIKDSSIAYFYSLTIYHHGAPSGTVRLYNNRTDIKRNVELCWVIPYLNGLKNGLSKEYDKDGKLEREEPYIEGIKNGVDKEYYPSGKLRSEYPYKNGKCDGIAKSYYENGALQYESIYQNNEKSTLRKGFDYDENGKLKCKSISIDSSISGDYERRRFAEKYTNGIIDIDTCYYESGKLKWECFEQYDSISPDINEVMTYYYESGGIMTKKIHRRDEKCYYYNEVSHTNYEENGKELKLSHFSRHEKSKVLNLLIGTWVYVLDSTLQVTVTKDEFFVSKHNYMGDTFYGPPNDTEAHDSYTLKYVDSTMKED